MIVCLRVHVFRWGKNNKSVSSKASPTYLMKTKVGERKMENVVTVSREQEVGKCVLLKIIGKFRGDNRNLASSRYKRWMQRSQELCRWVIIVSCTPIFTLLFGHLFPVLFIDHPWVVRNIMSLGGRTFFIGAIRCCFIWGRF